MTPGETDGTEPTYGRPLPPEDRLWRHPSEVAWESRPRRRPLRRFAAGLALSGVAAAAGFLFLTTISPAEVRVASDLVAVAGTNRSTSTVAIAATWADQVAEQASSVTVTVRSASGTSTLANGLMIDGGRYLITSGRALRGESEMLIVWGDQIESATLVGHDQVTDISVLRLDTSFAAADMADADPISSGDLVSLVNPIGRSEQRTVVLPISTSSALDGSHFIGIVELSGSIGAIEPGTPVVDDTGAIVGIVTATATDAPTALVPIDLAREIASEIIDHGEATHPRIGITTRTVLATDARGELKGSYVVAMEHDGPAAAGGVEVDDIIVAVARTPIESMAQMVAELRSYQPGDVVAILVDRDGVEVNCRIILGSNLDGSA